MNLLCLGFGHDGLAAVFKDGRLASAIATERLTRIKKQRGINREVVAWVLQQAGLSWSDIDLVGVLNWFYDRGTDGRELFDKASAGVQITLPNGTPISYEQYLQLYHSGNPGWGLTFHLAGNQAPCVVIDHHLGHCAYAYYMSPFQNAVCLSVDGSDDIAQRYSVYYFDDELKIARHIRGGMDFNIGGYYGCICDCLGFYPAVTDAGKVMALAAYGKPLADFRQILQHHVAPPGVFAVPDMVLHTLLRHGVRPLPSKSIFLPALKGEGGVADPAWLNKSDWRNELNRNIAATAQAVLEKAILDFLSRLADSTRHLTRNLCLSGGTMLNCVCNGKILHSGLFENIFVAPACGDDGGPIGAGLFLADRFSRTDKRGQFVQRQAARLRYSSRDAFEGGRRYSLQEIEEAIKRNEHALTLAGISILKRSEEEVIAFTVDQIIGDKIVGWFYRGSEFGPRALGHRSILANPCNPAMKDILNNRVKHREEFRPFAPVVLQELADQWFDLPQGVASPFMLFSVACRKPEAIPSAVHIDGSARVQTVDRETNGRFYELIAALGGKTGVPIVLNTSFNVQGEPIVESPDDAIRCFLGTEIDLLVLEQYTLEKLLH